VCVGAPAARARALWPRLTHTPRRLRVQLETNERVVYEKKRKLKQAIEAGKPIPTELREEEAELRHQIEMDDAKTEEVETRRACRPRRACARARSAPAPPLRACALTPGTWRQPRNAMDDEYVRAGEFDPRVMITTSRDPSSRLVQVWVCVCVCVCVCV